MIMQVLPLPPQPDTVTTTTADYERPQPSPLKVHCSVCNKLVKQAGLHDHKRAVHGAAQSTPEDRK